MKRFNSPNLSIESLERRDLMAADASLVSGVLKVKGTEAADHIVVSQELSNGFQTIKVTIEDIATGSVVLQKSFSAAAVSSLKVDCLGGADWVQNLTSKPSTMYGGAGEDHLVGGSAADTLYSGLAAGGADTGTNRLLGGGGNDTLRGGSAVDLIDGGAGDDYLYGADGDDDLNGQSGNDHLFGDSGADKLSGAVGNDYLYGGLGVDDLFGGEGDDYLYGKDEACGTDSFNRMYGGDGNDQIFGAYGADLCYGESGNDTIHGGKGGDVLEGGSGNDTLYGGEGNDYLWGDVGKDELHGNDGDDFLDGGFDDDFDLLAGGNGIDSLGGASLTVGHDDEYIFDAFDIYVDGLPGAARWGLAPKLTSGPYKGHGVHRG